MRKFSALLVALLTVVGLSACTGVPEKITPVTQFQATPYLGQWYEIARLPHPFEEGLSRVTATYAERDDGGISVLNRGYSAEDKEWSEAEGKAYFVEDPQTGHLKVSFFGPFYSSYIIWELGGKAEEGYSYAFISGYNHDYAWLLSRTPTVDDSLKQHFIEEAKKRGFDTSKLEFVSQQ